MKIGKLPYEWIKGNCLSARGRIWVFFEVAPQHLRYRATRVQFDALEHVTAAILALAPDVKSEFRVYGIAEKISPREIIGRMREGFQAVGYSNQKAVAAWEERCSQIEERLEGILLTDRRFYLAVQLPAKGEAMTKQLSVAAARGARNSASLLHRPPSGQVWEQLRRRVQDFEDALSATLTVWPTPAGEIFWFLARRLRLGSKAEPHFSQLWTTPAVSRPELRALDNFLIEEGALPEFPEYAREEVRLSGEHESDVLLLQKRIRELETYLDVRAEFPAQYRRSLRIETQFSTAYQALIGVTDMPEGYYFPQQGGSFLGRADKELSFPTEWVVRVRTVPNQEEKAALESRARRYGGQVEELGAVRATGVPESLKKAIKGVEEKHRELAEPNDPPGVYVTVCLSVAGEQLTEVNRRAGELYRLLAKRGDYKAARLIGSQEALLSLFFPGISYPAELEELSTDMSVEALAGLGLFDSGRLCDSEGAYIGESYEMDAFSGRRSRERDIQRHPAIVDMRAGAAGPRSACFIGKVGEGKSNLAKGLAADYLALGAQLVVLDPTQHGEWVQAAQVFPGSKQIIRIGGGSSGPSLDPLQIFKDLPEDLEDLSGEQVEELLGRRETYGLGVLSLMTGFSSDSPEGALLESALGAIIKEFGDGARLSLVVDELRKRAELQGSGSDTPAARVFTVLEGKSQLSRGAVFFGDRSALELDADCIIFHVPGIDLPEEGKKPSYQQLFDAAMLYMLTAVTKEAIFSDRLRFAIAILEEFWGVTQSSEGRKLITKAIKDGRKNNAALWVITQSPTDIPAEYLSEMGVRFVFSCGNGEYALDKVLGIEPTATRVSLIESGISRVSKQRRSWGGRRQGEEESLEGSWVFVRNVADEVDLVKLMPPTGRRRIAFETDPARLQGAKRGAELDLAAVPTPVRSSGISTDGKTISNREQDQ